MAKVDKKEIYAMWGLLPPDVRHALKKAVEALDRVVERWRTPVIAPCPRCGSKKTADCRNVEGIDDATVGLCIACGYVWCLECNVTLITSIACDHWKICANCGNRTDEVGNCGIMTWECPRLRPEGSSLDSRI